MQIRFQEEITPIILKKISKPVEPEVINLAIIEADNMIQEYCNIDTTPMPLMFILANITVDIIESQYIVPVEEEKEVSSIKQGDTTISFEKKQATVKKEDIPKNYAKTLNRYRKIRK